MRGEWKEVELGEVAPYWTKKVDADLLNSSNYVSADNMTSDRGGIVESVYVPSSGKYTLYEKNDVLISNIRPYFKKIWFANQQGGCSNDVIVFRANSKISDSKYIYYYLSKDDFFDYMMAGANGTKMPRGNKNAILNYPILLPPLPTQRKIASILSGYDDLIENNLKRIKLLEEKAQLTYEEWFVRMRFPGHEKTVFDEVTGLPEGWEKVKLEKVLSASNGKSFKGEFEKSSPFPVFGSNGIIGQSNNFNNEESIIVGRVGAYCGATKYCKGKFWATDNTISITSINKTMPNLLAFYLIKGFDLRNMAGGSAQPLLTQRLINNLEVVTPIESIASKFQKVAIDIFDSVLNFQNQNQLLKEARDILLPRLMSGLVDV